MAPYANYPISERLLLTIRRDIALCLQHEIDIRVFPWRMEEIPIEDDGIFIIAGLYIKDGDKIIFKLDGKYEKGTDHINFVISPSRESYTIGLIKFI